MNQPFAGAAEPENINALMFNELQISNSKMEVMNMQIYKRELSTDKRKQDYKQYNLMCAIH